MTNDSCFTLCTNIGRYFFRFGFEEIYPDRSRTYPRGRADGVCPLPHGANRAPAPQRPITFR